MPHRESTHVKIKGKCVYELFISFMITNQAQSWLYKDKFYFYPDNSLRIARYIPKKEKEEIEILLTVKDRIVFSLTLFYKFSLIHRSKLSASFFQPRITCCAALSVASPVDRVMFIQLAWIRCVPLPCV